MKFRGWCLRVHTDPPDHLAMNLQPRFNAAQCGACLAIDLATAARQALAIPFRAAVWTVLHPTLPVHSTAASASVATYTGGPQTLWTCHPFATDTPRAVSDDPREPRELVGVHPPWVDRRRIRQRPGYANATIASSHELAHNHALLQRVQCTCIRLSAVRDRLDRATKCPS